MAGTPNNRDRELVMSSRVRDIVSEAHGCVQRWNGAHNRGTDLILAIVQEKTHPRAKLQDLCWRLELICEDMESAGLRMRELASQAARLSILTGQSPVAQGLTTWCLQRLVQGLEVLASDYSRENEVKRGVLENVAHHLQDEAWRMLHLASWVHQTELTSRTARELEAMMVETKLR